MHIDSPSTCAVEARHGLCCDVLPTTIWYWAEHTIVGNGA